MQQENKELALLMSDLSKTVNGLNDISIPAESTLSEIRDVMTALGDSVKEISETVSSLSEEV